MLTLIGLFQPTVMPFGLVNALAIFQRMIDVYLANLIFKSCITYIDDVDVYSDRFFLKHLKCLEKVFQRLQRATLS